MAHGSRLMAGGLAPGPGTPVGGEWVGRWAGGGGPVYQLKRHASVDQQACIKRVELFCYHSVCLEIDEEYFRSWIFETWVWPSYD